MKKLTKSTQTIFTTLLVFMMLFVACNNDLNIATKQNNDLVTVSINVNIGEKPNDPVFCITDLLPHLSRSEMSKKTAEEFIKGEKLDISVGTTPVTSNSDDTLKTEEKEPAVEKAEEAEETVEEEATKEEAEIKKEDEAEEEVADEKEEAEIIKEEATDDEDLEAKITAIVEKVLAEKLAEKEDAVEEENPDPEKEPEDEDTPKITKSEKVVITEENQIKQSNYYQMSGRDPLTGKKIRN